MRNIISTAAAILLATASTVFHVSMRYWPFADKSVFRGVGKQPWQP